MRRLLAAVLAAAAGCYSPAAPSGSYECSDAAPDCPANLACMCGMCVDGPEAAACSLRLTLQSGGCSAADTAEDPRNLCVTEGERFPSVIEAFSDREGTKRSRYTGTARFDSTWGHARAASAFTFVDGRAVVDLKLDRATPGQKIYITARVGTAAGASETPILVDPPTFTAEDLPVVVPPFGWAELLVALPAIDHRPDGYTMYFSGMASATDPVSIGVATSSDGLEWTPAPAPLFTPAQGEGYFSPSFLRENDGTLHLFFNSHVRPTRVVASASSDGGKTFGPITILPHDCPGCGTGGAELPWVILNPTASDEWLLYFSTGVLNDPRRNIAVARTVNRGGQWTVNYVPTPRATTLFGDIPVYAPRVLRDPITGTYRMWFAQAPTLLGGCKLEIIYATSSEGQYWTHTRSAVPVMRIEDVPWARGDMRFQNAGIIPAAIEPPDPASPDPAYTMWYSIYVDLGLFGCAPYLVARAHRP